MFWIWLIGVIIIGSLAAYQLGKLDDYTAEEAFWPVVIVTIFWPIVMAIAIVIAPFLIPFILGRRAKNKRIEAEKAEKIKV